MPDVLTHPELASTRGVSSSRGRIPEAMVVWHVCSLRKLQRYKKTGAIMPPVRAWRTIQEAERFSLSTGRRLILRLRFPDNATPLAEHRGMAVVSYEPIVVDSV